MSKKEKLIRRAGGAFGNCLNYKGYTGSVEYSEEDAVFHGKVVGIKALISFEGDSVKAITDDFRQGGDEYLQFCADRGKEPERPFKGTFNVRIGAELHRKASLTAFGGSGDWTRERRELPELGFEQLTAELERFDEESFLREYGGEAANDFIKERCGRQRTGAAAG